MKLLVDIGNTRIKWVTLQQAQLSQAQAIAYQGISISEIIRGWQGLARPQSLYISCVGREPFKQELHHELQCLWPDINIFYMQTPVVGQGVQNSYKHPEKLGVDRWLAMTGAYADYKQALCIVDCGTAITLDCLDEKGQHLGGMIMAGWSMMQLSLHQGTAALEQGESSNLFTLADNTQNAINSGSLAAIRGFIQSGLEFMSIPCQLILTGGDALFLQKKLALDTLVDTELVFKGLALEAECDSSF